MLRMIMPLIFFAALAQAQTPEDDFIARYVAAVKAQDGAQRIALLHPEVRKCITPDNRDYFDYSLARGTDPRMPLQYKAAVTAFPGPAPADDALLLSVVAPTHRMRLDYAPSPTQSVTVVRELALADGIFYEVMGCPTKKGLAQFRKIKRLKDAQVAKAQHAQSSMPASLRKELLRLLQAGQKIDAIQYYRAQTKSSLEEAKSVVDGIQAEMLRR